MPFTPDSLSVDEHVLAAYGRPNLPGPVRRAQSFASVGSSPDRRYWVNQSARISRKFFSND
jgi:hypothetical protein